MPPLSSKGYYAYDEQKVKYFSPGQDFGWRRCPPRAAREFHRVRFFPRLRAACCGTLYRKLNHCGCGFSPEETMLLGGCQFAIVSENARLHFRLLGPACRLS